MNQGWEKTWATAPSIFKEDACPDPLATYLVEHLPKARTVLDIGCGLGRNSMYLSKHGHTVVGLDMSKTALRTVYNNAIGLGLSCHVVQADFAELPFKGSSFDAAISVNVVYHGTLAGIKDTIDQVGRMLNPGGRFLFNLLSKYSWQYDRYIEFVKNEKAYEIEPGTFIAYPRDAVFDMHLPHHFMDEEGLTTLLFPYNVVSITQDKHSSKFGSTIRWSVCLAF